MTLDQSQINDILATDPGTVVRLMTGGVQGMNLVALIEALRIVRLSS